MLGMGLLKVSTPDLCRRNMCRNREHGGTATMGIKQTINKMQVARATRSRANGKLLSDLGLATGGKGRDLFVARAHPLESAMCTYGLGNTIYTLSNHPINAFYTGLSQSVHQKIGYIFYWHLSSFIFLDEYRANRMAQQLV